MFNRSSLKILDLTNKEEELFCFLLDNSEKLGSEFNVHQVSCLHYIESKACYEKLYEKSLLKKPRRGIYSINVELLNYLEQKAEDEKKRLEELYKQEKETNRKLCAWFCRIFFIPMILLGALVCIISPIYGSISILIGVFEFIYSHKYFKKDKKKDE